MARDAASVAALIVLLDAILTARLTNDTQERARIGEHEYFDMSLDSLMAARKALVEDYESLSAGTENWDKFHDGATRDGSDNTVYTGDDET